MIVFTGSGSLAGAYKDCFPCRIISARNLNDKALREEISNATALIHNAANIDSNSLEVCIKDNFLLTKQLLDLANSINPELPFYYISSMSLLQSADSYKHVNEMSPYALSKYLGERYCLEHTHSNICCIRFSTLFYRNPNRDGISKLISDAATKRSVTLINNGSAKRDILPITIAVQYLNKMIENKFNKKKVNLVSGHPLSFNDVVKIIQHHLPVSVKNEVNESSVEVLYNFKRNDIEEIGEIVFDIEGDIIQYLKQVIYEDINIQ